MYLKTSIIFTMYSIIYAPKGKHGTLGRMIAEDINVPCVPLKTRHKRFKHSIRTLVVKKKEVLKIKDVIKKTKIILP